MNDHADRPSLARRLQRPRLVIADDDAVVRSALSGQLGYDFDVLGAACDAQEAIALTTEHQPDVVVLDVEMPGGGGLRATREIQSAAPTTAIVALSADESHERVLEMLKAGAMSYVRKGSPGDELVATLRQSITAHERLADGRD